MCLVSGNALGIHERRADCKGAVRAQIVSRLKGEGDLLSSFGDGQRENAIRSGDHDAVRQDGELVCTNALKLKLYLLTALAGVERQENDVRASTALGDATGNRQSDIRVE